MAMAVVLKFKYLGVVLHGAGDITKSVGHRHSRMVAAQSAVNKHLKELRIQFDPMVVGASSQPQRPQPARMVARFGPLPLVLAGQCKMQSYQAAVYTLCLCVPESTGNLLTVFEIGRYPMQIRSSGFFVTPLEQAGRGQPP
jgi:hypothetical protein